MVGLLAAVAVVVRLAGRTTIPEPVLLMLVGLAVALIPGLRSRARPGADPGPVPAAAAVLGGAPHRPAAAARKSRPIGLLAVGLVLVTTAAVAVLGHTGLPCRRWRWCWGRSCPRPTRWPRPRSRPDSGCPWMVAILEGEGLLNDATALVVYRMAVAAAVSGAFSLLDAGVELVVSAVGGTAVGLAVGWVGNRILRRVSEAPVENTVKLLLPRGLAGRRAGPRLRGAGRARLRGADGAPLGRHLLGRGSRPASSGTGWCSSSEACRSCSSGCSCAPWSRGSRALPGRPGPGRPGRQPGGHRRHPGPGVPGQLAAAAVGPGARPRAVPRLAAAR